MKRSSPRFKSNSLNHYVEQSVYHIDMLCKVCWRMLREQVGRQWKGSYDLHFSHHESFEELKASHNMGCGICRVLFEKLLQQLDGNEDVDRQREVGSFHSSAFLAVAPDFEGEEVFRLDFKLELGSPAELIGVRTFVLQQTGEGITNPS